MRIGIAARGLSEISGGVKQYIESITKALLGIDNKNQYFIFYDNEKHKGKFSKGNEIILRSKNKLWYDYIKLPRALNKYKIDICVFPKNIVPFNIQCRSINIIHDLLHIKDPKVYKWYDSLYMKILIPKSIKKADAVITVSKNTKNDLMELINIPTAKIHVIHEAADEKFTVIDDKNSKDLVIKEYKLKLPFILYVGSLSPRKNIPALIKAFARLKEEQNIPHSLVLAGSKAWKQKNIINEINKSPYKKDIILTGFVTEQDIPLIYNLAELFIYPSFYEGFGLPILEAMACGCPVICSNTSSLPEVGGEATLYFDPKNNQQLYRQINKVLFDKQLKNDLRQKGFTRAYKFSWKKSAELLLSIINNIS